MSLPFHVSRFTRAAFAAAASLALVFGAQAQQTNRIYDIDLATTLRLAGAQNLDVQLAREKLAEARANNEGATWRFLPWIAPGLAYRGHDNAIQNVEGRILDVQRGSFQAGPALIAQLEVGEAIYAKLAARQLAKAAEHAVEIQRNEIILATATGYFDLASAQAAAGVAGEAVRISDDYLEQVGRAVEAGLAFKGDALRVRTQLERDRLTLRQAQERHRLAGTRLAQLLRLDSTVELVAKQDELTPLSLVPTNAPLDGLVAQALGMRSKLQQSRALVQAATAVRNGAVYGPLVPGVGAQVFVGGLAGGNQTTSRSLGESEDYQVTLAWRIGPGGLFDRSRIHAADARLKSAQLADTKLRDEITRQVVDGFTRVQSGADQLATTRRGLAAAEEAFRLTRERREFGVGVVLETIQAEQELTRLRSDYVITVGEFNKAQYSLLRAVGGTQLRAAGGVPDAKSAIPEAAPPSATR
jgi:outer membrane protein TolC